MNQPYECLRCAVRYPFDLRIDSRGCPVCFDSAPSNFRVVPSPRRHEQPSQLTSLWRYASRLPCPPNHAVSLGEGLTPLLAAERFGYEVDVPNLLIKDEGRNPTWSHKDRFSTVAVSAARARGATVVATSSSGNAGASLAAYAAQAGLKCVVATFADAVTSMVQQIAKYGAEVIPFVDKADRWAFLAQGVERYGWFATSPYQAPVVGSHPLGNEGYKTLAYEIVDQLEGEVPDWCALPVCYGDALSGLWLGFKELLSEGRIRKLPRLLAAEVHGSLSAALALANDRITPAEIAFETLAVSVGTPQSTYQALVSLRESNGCALQIDNGGIVSLQEKLASTEGIFVELASILPMAAVARARQANVIARSDRVVAIVTASGLKDLDRSAPATVGKSFNSTHAAWRHLGVE